MNNFNKTQKNILIIGVVLIVAIICYYVYGRETDIQNVLTDEEILAKDEQNGEKIEDKIIVHITGAVNQEGIVTLGENARIADAVKEAGGLKEDADMSKINLAYILEDGMKINIPSINDTDKSSDNQESTNNEEIVENIPDTSLNSTTSIVNINKASQIELETLPGIGPSTALKIVNYRKENGKFSEIEDLKKVDGIGENKFEKIKKLICIK